MPLQKPKNYALLSLFYIFIFPLLTKIHAHIDVQGTEGIVGREMIFMIIVRMNDRADTRIPFVIIPYHTKTAHTIDVEVLEVEVLQIKLVQFRVV